MLGWIEGRRRAVHVWIAAFAVLAAAPAGAVIVNGTTATFRWTQASGPVAGYVVYVVRNNSPAVEYASVYGTNEAVISGAEGDWLYIYVAAFDANGVTGPISTSSPFIQFQSPPVGSGGDPGAEPAPEPTPEPDPTPEPEPTPPPPVVSPPPRDTPFDHDGDGLSDLVQRRSSNGDLSLWSMDADGLAAAAPIPPSLSAFRAIRGTGDYDGDGTADILWRNTGNNVVKIYLMRDGQVRETVRVADGVSASLEIVGNADYDGDGRADILLFHSVTRRLEIWHPENGGFDRVVLPADFGTDPQVIASGDFDGDGLADILWRDRSTGDVSIWGATAPVNLGALEGGESAWVIIGAGDFDGDLRDDLLLRSSTSGILALRMTSTATREVIVSDFNTNAAVRYVPATGDYDGNGRLDLVVFDPARNEHRIWYLDGATAIAEVQIPNPDAFSSFASVDARPPGSR